MKIGDRVTATDIALRGVVERGEIVGFSPFGTICFVKGVYSVRSFWVSCVIPDSSGVSGPPG